MSAFLLILWVILLSLTVIALGFAVLFTAVLHNAKQLRAFDTVLCISTFMILLFMAGLAIPNDTSPKKKGAATLDKPDRLNVNLLEEEYLDSTQEPFKTYFKFQSKSSYQGTLKEAEKSYRKDLEQKPEDILTASKLALVLDAENLNPSDAFKPFHEYLTRTGAKADTDDAAVEDILTHPPSKFANSNGYELLLSRYPKKGWFNKQINWRICAVDANSEASKKFIKDQKRQETLFVFKCEAISVTYAILCLTGFAFLFYLFKPIPVPAVVPITTSFRRMYVCLLSILFGQCLSGFILSLGVGFYIAFNHIKGGIAPYNVFVTTAAIAIGIIAFLLSYYFAIAKPLEFGFVKSYNFSALQLSKAKFFAYCTGGFGVAVFCSQASSIISRYLLNIGAPATSGQKDLSEAIFNGNFSVVYMHAFFMSVIAPLSEELLFRGLFYTWLRIRFGAFVSSIISSAVFSIFHFNPNGFFHYFTLGCILCLIYERTRNLWICVAVHALWNTFVLLLMWCASP